MTAVTGVLAEFASAHEVLAAARAARQAGYVAVDIYSPYPLEDAPAALALRSHLPLVALVAGAVGGLGMFLFQVWAQAIDWRLDIGGRRALAAPAFFVPSFELTILSAALVTVFAMLWRNGLPRLSHPLFEVPTFVRASRDRFFVSIAADDPKFELAAVRAFLGALAPLEVHDVPR